MEESRSRPEEGTSRALRKRGRFQNPHHRAVRRRLLHLLLWRLGYYSDEKPPEPIPEGFQYPRVDGPLDPTQPTVTWVNHSTFLLQLDGINILTDPIWSKRCSPFDFIGPSRHFAPPLAMEQLPPIHYVLISHNHYDHLDKATVLRLRKLHPQAKWLVPQGLKRWFSRRGIQDAIELSWWEMHHRFNIEFHFVPAQHYTGRGPLDYNRSLWGGWVVRAGQKTLYFAGDTGYNTVDFRELGRRFPKIDLSLIPIGVYRPFRFMSPVHVCPREAIQIHQDVGSRLSVGSHWNTFRLSSEPRDQPAYDLYRHMLDLDLPLETFRVLDPGQTINW